MLGNGIKKDNLGTYFMFNWEDGLILAFLEIFQIGIPRHLYMKELQAVTSLEAGLITMVEPICIQSGFFYLFLKFLRQILYWEVESLSPRF